MNQPPITVLATEHLTDMPEANARHSLHVWALGHAHRIFDDGDEVRPTWVVVAGDSVLFVDTSWGDEAEKRACIIALRTAMAKFRVSRYSFMCETWISTQELDPKNPDKRDYPMPSDDPDHRDGLIVLTCDKEGHDAACFEVKYDDSGKRVRRYLEEVKGYTNIGGRMAELLR